MTEPDFSALAKAREAAGMSLEEAARRLKFAPRQLQALEAGELQRLPGATFVRGMLKSYARLVQVDPEPLLARVGEQLVPLDAERLAQRYRQPVPFSDGARRSNLAYLALSVVLLAAVVVVALQWRQERAGAARMAFVSAAPQPVEPPHVTVASTASAPQIPPPQIQAPQVQAPQLQAPPAPAARLERTADAPPPAGWGRLVLQFEDESWVEIYSGTGKLLVAQLHAEGTERVVTGVPPFSLVIGNAPRVRLSYNDKPVDLMPHVRIEVARFTLK